NEGTVEIEKNCTNHAGACQGWSCSLRDFRGRIPSNCRDPASMRYAMPMQKPPFSYAHENYPLAPSTLYGVGGPATIALLPRNEDEVREAYNWMATQDVPRLILGG